MPHEKFLSQVGMSTINQSTASFWFRYFAISACQPCAESLLSLIHIYSYIHIEDSVVFRNGFVKKQRQN
jgi:hypothetical protein